MEPCIRVSIDPRAFPDGTDFAKLAVRLAAECPFLPEGTFLELKEGPVELGEFVEYRFAPSFDDVAEEA